MKVAVTGSDGFLGRAVVQAVTQRGWQAVALSRRNEFHRSASNVKSIPVDMRSQEDLTTALKDVDVVIHCASAKSGTFHDQYPSTVIGTRNLVRAAAAANVGRIVLVSSFAVFDYKSIPVWSRIDELSLLDLDGEGRDAYAQTKTVQEVLCRELCAETGTRLVVARPGVIYGPGSHSTYRVGEEFGRLLFAFGSRGQLPHTFVNNCADALTHLAGAVGVDGSTYNLLDDPALTQRQYRRELHSRLADPPRTIVVPWRLAIFVTHLLGIALRTFGVTGLRLPSFLIPQSMAVRAKPFRYSNERLKRTGWIQQVSLGDGLDLSVGKTKPNPRTQRSVR